MHDSFKQMWWTKPLLILLVLLTNGVLVHTATAQEQSLKGNPLDKKQVKHGHRVYQRFCALSCHGANLKGQPNWRKRRPNNKLPAPPHDETGHTWHHPDDMLFGIIKQGLVPPYAPANYKSDMPAWGGTLKDEDIWAVLAYIKSRWPAETRKIQAQVSQDSQRQGKP